ncbi:hypothetical protein ACH427_03270 [Streptomyces sp. NPDC020379]|uniref:hypothetical protein n=1 Tax=Streptomyces sp. NPDC020379 TaxID=3365071 RepID=UPI0037A4F0DD
MVHFTAVVEWSGEDAWKSCPLAFSLSRHARRQELAAAIFESSFTDEPVCLLMTTGAALFKVEAAAGHYYDVVLTDLATDDCAKELHNVLTAQGLPRWRHAVVDLDHADRPHPHFPGSASIRYLIIHPEAAA